MQPERTQAEEIIPPEVMPTQMRRVERREWWLWGFAVTVTLVLTLGIVSLTIPWFRIEVEGTYWSDLKEWVRGLAALVLLFDIYTIYQHLQLHRIRRRLVEQDELFRLISENAADMIALIDAEGRRLYNSPAYQKVLGYTAEELKSTSAIEQIHPDDRPRVREAAEKARVTGQGQRLEYRIRHKDGTWRTLESTASVIHNTKGQTEKLVIVNRDISERKRAEEMLVHNAFHDTLTNLPNRALFLDRLQRAFALAKRRQNYQFAVLFIDIDEFKIVNDSLGHSIGDELLVKVGRRLSSSLRRDDTVSRPRPKDPAGSVTTADTLARLGGDEFTVLLDDIRHPSDAVRVAERIQRKLAAPLVVREQEMVISASIGIALSSTAREKAEDLLRDADIAMYRAKRAGKARCEIFDAAMHATAVKRLRLETDLRKAVERQEFLNYYQPIVSLQTGEITGFEALVRWQRSDGLVLPGEFVAVANETGLIVPINRFLVREACKHLHQWNSGFSCNPPLTMSMNVSAREFAQPDLANDIRLALNAIGVEPARLQLEIMETIAMGDAERAGEVLQELKALGVRLCIDDFGTGYSSLSRLQRFPVDTLKIDRSFISKMDVDAETHEIVRIIIALAHSLGMKVVAEGTETAAQVQELKELGCELAQGYFFSRPCAEQVAKDLLSTRVLSKAAAAAQPV